MRRDSKVVRPRERVREVELYVRVPRGLPWGEYYVVSGILGILVVTAAEQSVSAFAPVAPAQWAVLFFLEYVVSAAYHAYDQREKLPFGRRC